MPASVELLFRLELEDDWPPAAVEGIWGEWERDGFRALTCPLFVQGLSVDDVISPKLDDAGEVVAFDVLHPSQHSTVWVIASDPTLRESVLGAVRALGCNTVSDLSSMPSLCAIDVPGYIAIGAIDAILGPHARAGEISVAYPSFRHVEGG